MTTKSIVAKLNSANTAIATEHFALPDAVFRGNGEPLEVRGTDEKGCRAVFWNVITTSGRYTLSLCFI